MRIAIPLYSGSLCMHFGHCEQFGIYDIDNKTITKSELFTPPPHEPGLYPRLLAERKVNLIISGGMGMNAQKIFNSNGIEVITGASGASPEEIINAYLSNTLVTGDNACSH